MKFRQLAIPDVLEVIPDRLGDSRGFFSETYSQAKFEQAGVKLNWVQDNHSYSASAGVLRGLHYQAPPFAQDKLVRVVRGAILDVAVDIRHGSPTYGRWVSLRLSPADWNQILVPKGFAHGFLTLAPETEVIYKVSAYYSPEHDRGLLWNDPALGIVWPVGPSDALLSDKDGRQPALAELPQHFRY